MTLSQAFRLLENQFCTREARNILRQELVSLTLAQVRQTENCDRADALRCLKRKIDRLSANGPHDYRSETCKIDVLIDCLKGERWALPTILRCKENENTQSLQSYIDCLLNFIHTSANLANQPPSNSASDQILLSEWDPEPSSYEDDDAVYFGDTRASPRFKGGFRRSHSQNSFGRGPNSPRGYAGGQRDVSRRSQPSPSHLGQRQLFSGATRSADINHGSLREGPRSARPDSRGGDLRLLLQSRTANGACPRCHKRGCWKNCSAPRQSVTQATRAYLASHPDDAPQLATMLVANVDDAYVAEGEDTDASDVLLAAHGDSDSESIVQDQHDAVNEVYAAMEKHCAGQDFR